MTIAGPPGAGSRSARGRPPRLPRRLDQLSAGLYISAPAQAAGPVAEWLCRGLQSLVRRFDSGPGLQAQSGTPAISRIQVLACPRAPPTPPVFRSRGRIAKPLANQGVKEAFSQSASRRRSAARHKTFDLY